MSFQKAGLVLGGLGDHLSTSPALVRDQIKIYFALCSFLAGAQINHLYMFKVLLLKFNMYL